MTSSFALLERPRMDKTISIAAQVVMWLSAFATGVILRIPSPIGALMCLMGIDMVTGLLSSWRQHSWDSTKCTNGVIKKALVLLILLAVNVVEGAAGENWTFYGLNLHADRMLAVGFMFAEFISITENCAMGEIWLPEWMVLNLIRFKKVRAFRQASSEQLKELGEKVTRAENSTTGPRR